jgi:predicted nucleic acid-binding Zn ribbon protein
MKKVGDLLRQYLREKGWLSGSPYDPLFRGWEKIAGAALARHTRLVDVQKGILLVEVDHPGWLQMLRLRQVGLLEAARRAAPGVGVDGIKARVRNESWGPAAGPAADR